MLLNYGTQYNSEGAQENYAQDKLDPSFFQTAANGFLSGFSSPFTAIQNVTSDITGKKPEGEAGALQEASDTFNDISSSGSGVASFLGNALGMVVNPINIVGVGGAGEATSLATEGLLDYGAPKLAETALTPTLNVRDAFSRMGASAVGGSAAMLAPSIVGNYNESTTKINWGGVAKGVAIGGGIGLGLGAIPFAYGLLKYRAANGLPITEAEEEAVNKGLGEHISSNLDDNIQKQQQAEQTVNKYVNNPNVTIDQGLINSKLLDETDLGNMQSTIADMLSSDETIDPDTVASVVSPALRPLLEDGQAMGALKEAQLHIQNLHEDVAENLQKVLSNRQKKLLPALQKVLNFSDEQMEKYKAQENGEFLKSVANRKTFKGSSMLQKALDTVKESPEKFGKRTQQQAMEMQLILDTQDKLDHYNQALKTVDTLNSLGSRLQSEESTVKTYQNFMNKRASQTAPLPKVAPEENNTTQTQQKIERTTELSPDESIDEDELPKDAQGLREPLEATKKAIKSLRSNSKVLGKLVKCIMENK